MTSPSQSRAIWLEIQSSDSPRPDRPVANFTIIFNPRRFDKNSNSWVKGEPISWRCEAWNQGQLSRAENICNMLKRGDSVVAIGVLETKTWTSKENEPRSRIQVKVESIGKDLTFHGQAYAANEAPEQRDGGNWGATSPPRSPTHGARHHPRTLAAGQIRNHRSSQPALKT
ncbi:single-stranded DNA-binding protein [Arthrobacter sp. Hiyo6]|nr:single-stranded DNA-binding protein [Arthrobacter sp. Hiyo6]